jgi:hypothetical protein
VNGRIQQERNVKHFTLQQQGSSRLDLDVIKVEKIENEFPLIQLREGKRERVSTSGKRVRRSENRPGDCG